MTSSCKQRGTLGCAGWDTFNNDFLKGLTLERNSHGAQVSHFSEGPLSGDSSFAKPAKPDLSRLV